MAKIRPKIIITSGEPAGIGPDVCLALGREKFDADITVLGDPVVFSQRAGRLGLDDAFKNLRVVSVNTKVPVQAGRLERQNANMVLEQLNIAISGCLQKNYHAMVTAPLHKGIINDGGTKFTGHTEYLAQKCGEKKPLMMLSCEQMRVALVTTHLPLSEVESKITESHLIHCLEVLYNDLRLRFGIERPAIAVCGLNPHAGEQGHLGTLEQTVISPTLDLARQSGMNILGPLPADTAFTPKYLNQVDAVLTMYHDQGLPVLKYASFGKGVNITLGLPIIRTSVDHGTALDLAGSGRADPSSMIEAVATAIEMVHTQKFVRTGVFSANNSLMQNRENIPQEKVFNKTSQSVDPMVKKSLLIEAHDIDSHELDFDFGTYSSSSQIENEDHEMIDLTESMILRQNLYDQSDDLLSLDEIGVIGIPEIDEENHIKPSEDELNLSKPSKVIPFTPPPVIDDEFKAPDMVNYEDKLFDELDILKAMKNKQNVATKQNNQEASVVEPTKNDSTKVKDKEKKSEDEFIDVDAAIRTMTDIAYKP